MAAVGSSLVSLRDLPASTLDERPTPSRFAVPDSPVEIEAAPHTLQPPKADIESVLDLASVAFDPAPGLFAEVALAEIRQLVGHTEVQERLIPLALGQDVSAAINGDPAPQVRNLAALALEAGTEDERFLIWRAEQALTRASADPAAQEELLTFVSVPAVRDRFLKRLEEPGPKGVAAAIAFHRSSDPVVLETVVRLLRTRPELEGPIVACAGTSDISLINALCARAAVDAHAGRVAAVLSLIDNDAARQIVKGAWGREIFDGRASIDSRFSAAQSLRPLMQSDPEAAAALAKFLGANKFSLMFQGAQWNFSNFGLSGSWDFLRTHRGAPAWHTLKVACAIALLDSQLRTPAIDFLQEYSRSYVPLEAYGIRDRVRGIIPSISSPTTNLRDGAQNF